MNTDSSTGDYCEYKSGFFGSLDIMFRVSVCQTVYIVTKKKCSILLSAQEQHQAVVTQTIIDCKMISFLILQLNG